MLDATPLLKLYARRRLARLDRQDPAAAQEVQLRRLLRQAADTRFGRDHGFAGIGKVAEFQARVPVRRYEDFWADYWRDAFPLLADRTWPGRIPYFAETSGTTTGRTKFIPVSEAMLRSNTKAAFDLLCFHLAARSGSHVLGGRVFLLGGSVALTRRAKGVLSGDLSGIAARATPWWASRRLFPHGRDATTADWETKIERLARAARAADVRAIGGTSSWLLLFFERLAALNPDLPPRLAALFPRLDLVVHGGVAAAPYRPAFAQWLQGSAADLREVYPASEGFLAIEDRVPGDGLRLIADHGLFYEFVPVEELDRPNPTRHWLATIEPGINYAVVLSSCAGLWAYRLGDTVRFLSRRPPRLMVSGRTAYDLSAFGEHLIAEEAEGAIARAAEAIGAPINDFAAGACFPERPGERGGHLFVVEFAKAVDDSARLAAFAEIVDRALAEANDDYRSHRARDFGMDPPRIRAVPPGTFAAWMKARGQLGGQHKVPRLIADRDLFRSLTDFADRRG